MYDYTNYCDLTFTDEGQRNLLKVRDKAFQLIKVSGAVSMQNLMIIGGDSWEMMAYVDRLVELGDLIEIEQGHVAGQFRLFRMGNK